MAAQKKKSIVRNVYLVEVLSEEPIGDMSLINILRECKTGDFSCSTKNIVENKPIKGIHAVRAIKAQGTDPEFFLMDDEGYEID